MKKWFVFLAVVTSLTGTCFAQEKPTAKKEQQAKSKQAKAQPARVAEAKQEKIKQPVIKFSMGMLESGRIDPKYTGYPAADVIAAIEKLTGTKKGEFESTADYNARKATALTAKFLGDSSVEDTFAFVVPVWKGGKVSSGLRYEFNADTGDVNLYALPSSSEYLSLNGIGAPDGQTNRRASNGLDQFTLSTKTESQGTYYGSNAYGATVKIEETHMSKAGIAANRIPFLQFERATIFYANPAVASQFKLDNSRAAAELPALKALIVMKLSDPYVVYDFSHKKPTRDSPTDLSVQSKYLTGDVLGIVYYSGRTGEIFARLPETFGSPNAGAALVGESDEATYYIAPAIIRKDGNLRKVWEIFDLKKRDEDGVMSWRGRFEYDCKEEQTRVLAFSKHSEPMAGGETLWSRHGDAGEWSAIRPGSAAEAILKRVCAK